MLKRIIIFLLVILVVLGGLLFTPQFSHLKNFAIWGKHTIHDYKTHPTRLVASGGAPQYWPLDSNYNKGVIPDSLRGSMPFSSTAAVLLSV